MLRGLVGPGCRLRGLGHPRQASQSTDRPIRPTHTADTTRGFGFVHYETAEDAAAAMDNMEGACLPVHVA